VDLQKSKEAMEEESSLAVDKDRQVLKKVFTKLITSFEAKYPTLMFF
jgi:hypothetical protein